MALRLPTADDLQKMAAASRFRLSPEELVDFQALMPAMFETLDALDRMPLAETPLKYPNRDAGSRPDPKSDPFNAIIRRCSVKGATTGKLAGKRIGIKDNISVAGVPMTCGSSVMEGYVPTADATLVTRILDAGGSIVAKLNLDNFAFAGAGDTSSFGPTRNPHNPDFLAGGSSGGDRFALDSNLDWNQDVYRLADWIGANAPGRPCAIRLTGRRNAPLLRQLRLDPESLVASPHGRMLFISKNVRLIDRPLPWLARYRPIARVGDSIDVYDLTAPPNPGEPDDAPWAE